MRRTVLIDAHVLGPMLLAIAYVTSGLSSGAADNSSAQVSSGQHPTGFIDVTMSCGIAAAIEQHYEHYPKWWLSGLNLVDLDGDGNLDLFLAAHGAGRS